MEDGLCADQPGLEEGASWTLQTITNKLMKHLLLFSIIALVVCTAAVPTSAQNNVQPLSVPTFTEHDGQHDFDFEIGAWKTHLRRLLHPLTGSTTWVEYEGTTVVRKVWNGRANLAELVADGPAGHFEGLSCVYTIPNPTSGVSILPAAAAAP